MKNKTRVPSNIAWSGIAALVLERFEARYVSIKPIKAQFNQILAAVASGRGTRKGKATVNKADSAKKTGKETATPTPKNK